MSVYIYFIFTEFHFYQIREAMENALEMEGSDEESEEGSQGNIGDDECDNTNDEHEWTPLAGALRKRGEHLSIFRPNSEVCKNRWNIVM